MYLFDQYGNFKRWNDNFEKVTGYGPNLIGKMTPLDFIVSNDRDIVKNAIDRVFKHGRATVEAGLSTVDGQTLPFLFTGYKFVQEGMSYLVGVGLDISQRVHSEKEKEKLIGRLKQSLSHVKQLSGLLPICASCKKIRDDKGYWNQIESYIRNHSEADFSHGLCPDCMETLYGDQAWYKRTNK